MIRRRPAIATLAGAVLAAMVLAGCGGGKPSAGPFDGGTGRSWYCSPAESPDRVFTAGGIWQIRNAGPAAVIGKVSLTHPRALLVLGAYAVPITGHEAYGNWNGAPSPHDVSVGVQWSRRQRADGARIPPTRGHGVIDLVLVVKLLGANGSTDGLDVNYRTAGGQYLLHIGHGLALTTARKIGNCPP